MKTELIIRSNSSDIDFALLRDGKLIELNNETSDNKFSVGDIFLAKIGKVLTGLNAAFVNVGYPKDGFLHYHDLGAQVNSLNTFIKTQMRSISSDPISISAGGLALSIKHTLPSAELIIELGISGVFLFGFLKNQRVNKVSM